MKISASNVAYLGKESYGDKFKKASANLPTAVGNSNNKSYKNNNPGHDKIKTMFQQVAKAP